MSKITPNYYAILTADVRYDKRLSPSEKLLFAEITALTHSNGHCHATNEYLASLYDLSADRVSHMISKLVKLGYLNSIINYKEGTKQVESRHLSLPNPIAKFNYTSSQKDREGVAKNSDTPIAKNSEDNNTSIEQYKNNNIKEKNQSDFSVEDFKKFDIDVSDFTNEQLNSIIQWINHRKKTYKCKTTPQAIKVVINHLRNAKEHHNLVKLIDYFINFTTYQNINPTNIELAIKQRQAGQRAANAN